MYQQSSAAAPAAVAAVVAINAAAGPHSEPSTLSAPSPPATYCRPSAQHSVDSTLGLPPLLPMQPPLLPDAAATTAAMLSVHCCHSCHHCCQQRDSAKTKQSSLLPLHSSHCCLHSLPQLPTQQWYQTPVDTAAFTAATPAQQPLQRLTATAYTVHARATGSSSAQGHPAARRLPFTRSAAKHAC